MNRFRKSSSFVVTLALVAGLGAAVLPASAGTKDLDPCSDYIVAAGKAPELAVVNGHGQLNVRKKGQRLQVTLNGAEVPSSRLEKDGPILYVKGASGETLFMIGVFGGFSSSGQLAYTPDLDPASMKNRFGIKVDYASEELASQLNLGVNQALVVPQVCAGTPSQELRKFDVIVGVDGRKPVSLSLLQKAAAAKQSGQELRLKVLRNGREEEVSMVAGPVKPWPAPDTLEQYLRKVVNE